MTHGFNIKDELTRAEVALANVVERKVKAATTAATCVSVAVSLLGLYVFHGTVPDWAVAGVGSLVTGALTYLAGYIAKHTPRTIPGPPVAPGNTEPAPAPGSTPDIPPIT